VNNLQDIDKDIETIWKELQVNEKMNRISLFFKNNTEINYIFFRGTGSRCLFLGFLLYEKSLYKLEKATIFILLEMLLLF
jgi:hypothetical protein